MYGFPKGGGLLVEDLLQPDDGVTVQLEDLRGDAEPGPEQAGAGDRGGPPALPDPRAGPRRPPGTNHFQIFRAVTLTNTVGFLEKNIL